MHKIPQRDSSKMERRGRRTLYTLVSASLLAACAGAASDGDDVDSQQDRAAERELREVKISRNGDHLMVRGTTADGDGEFLADEVEVELPDGTVAHLSGETASAKIGGLYLPVYAVSCYCGGYCSASGQCRESCRCSGSFR